MKQTFIRPQNDRMTNSGFVVDGHERALDAIEAEVRSEVEEAYADEWNASGIVKRFVLLRKIKREIADRVAEHSKQISPDSLF